MSDCRLVFRFKNVCCFFMALLVLMGTNLKADVPAEVQAIFVTYCTGCHGTQRTEGELSLQDAATSEMELVDIDAICNASLKLVEPGDLNNSALYQKITDTGCGTRMPPSGNALSQADINTIANWINGLAFGSIQMEAATATVQEGDAEITLTVTRTLNNEGQVTFRYSVISVGSSDNDAMPGEDYTEVIDADIIFEDGEISKTIVVTLAPDNDSDDDGSRDFFVTLSDPDTNAGAVLGSQNQTQVTILDNDDTRPGTFFMSRQSTSVAENVGSFDVTILRTSGTFGVVTVQVSSNQGTATNISDYLFASQILTFDDGVSSQTVTVSIEDDTEQEGDETFTLILSNPSGGADIGALNTTSVTIEDNDDTADDTNNDGGNNGDNSGNNGGNSGNNNGGNNNNSGNDDSYEPQNTEIGFQPAGSLFYLLGLFFVQLMIRVYSTDNS